MHISRLKKLFFDLNKKIGFSFISNLSQCKNKQLALDVTIAILGLCLDICTTENNLINFWNYIYAKICWNISLTYLCTLTENKWWKVAFRLNAFVSKRNITIKTMMLYLFLIRKKYSFSFVFVRSSILHVAFLPVIANLVDTNIW